MSSARKKKAYPRSIEGLRDALFDEVEDLRDGVSSPHETAAFCALAERVLDTFDAEIKQRTFDLAVEERKLRIQERRVALLTYKPEAVEEEGVVLNGEEPEDMQVVCGTH